MDKILIPKIETPKLSPLDFDISLNSPLNSPEFSPIPTEKKEEDIIKKIQRDILNSPKVDLDKIDEQYQDKYVKVTPDELKKINKGDEISERIKFDDNYEALMRSTQTNTERYLNTAKNFGVAASSSFIGGLATIPNIIGSTINVAGYLSGRDKPISEFFNVGWDSGLNKTLFEFSNEVAENNRNYKSNWSKENWIRDMIPFFGDGGFQDFVASSGYTVGAMAEAFLTGGIGSVISKGTKLAGLGGRISKYLNNPAKLDKMLSLFKAINKEDNVRKVIGEAGYLIGKGIEEAPQLYRMYAGSHFESAFEGLEGAKRFEEEAIQKYKENNFGMLPDQKTLENIKSTAQEIGDMRYGLNLAVLMIPNYLQMGALLKTFPGAQKMTKALVGDKLLGELEAVGGKINVRTAKDIKLNWNLESKIGKYFENAANKTITGVQKYGKIPLSFSEGGEEYMQYIIDEYTSSLYKGAYLNPQKAKDIGEYFSQMYKTLVEQGTSKEAAQAFLMGSAGGGFQQAFNSAFELATNSNKLKNKIANNERIAAKLEDISERMFSSQAFVDGLHDSEKEKLKDIVMRSLNQNSVTGTLEDKYNKALSALNMLSLSEDILQTQDINAQRWYYNLKDRHLSQLLHDVVSTGRQDVFKEHLQELAKASPESIKSLYGIDMKDQTRTHVDFVNDVTEKLNKIEGISEKINFAFNEDFKDPLLAEKYRQYKQEMSHLKYMIDRQKERKNSLLTPRTEFIQTVLSGDLIQLEARINTLKLVQPDTQDYANAQKDLKRLEKAYKAFKAVPTFDNDGDLKNVDLEKLAEGMNAYDDVQDNTVKTINDDLRIVNDIAWLDAGSSNESPFVTQYRKYYSEDGFNKYLEDNKEYFEELEKLFNKDNKKEEIVNKTEEVLKDVPENVKNKSKDEVTKIIEEGEEKGETEQEIKNKIDSVIQKNTPPVKIDDVEKAPSQPPIITPVVNTPTPEVVIDNTVLDKIGEINDNQKTAINKINKLIEDGKKANLIKQTKEKESHYSFLGKLYKRVSNFIGDLLDFTDKDKVTNIKNSLVVGNYFDVFARMYFKNNNLTIEEFQKALKEKETKDGKEQFTKIEVEKIFNESKNKFKQIQDDIKKQLNDNNLVFITDEIFVHTDIKLEEGWDGVAGTLDMVVVDSKGIVHIYDFKTKAENDSRYPITKDKIEKPFSKKQKSDKEKWTDQQTAYSIMLEQTLGYKPNINIVVIPVSYKKEKFEGDFKNKTDVENFNPLPFDLKLAKTSPFIYTLKFDENNKLVTTLKTPSSTKSEIEGQIGTSNYYVNEGLIFYQNEDGTLKPIPNPDKKDVLEVVKDDIEERRRFETVYVEDRLKKEADLAKTLDFTNHRDETLWKLLGMFFQAITEFTSKGKNYTIVKGFSKYYKNVLDEEGNVVIVISKSGLEYDIHNTSREEAKEILSHAQKKGYDENKEKQINDKYDKELESLNQQNVQKQPTTDIEAKKADIEKTRQEELSNTGLYEYDKKFKEFQTYGSTVREAFNNLHEEVKNNPTNKELSDFLDYIIGNLVPEDIQKGSDENPLVQEYINKNQQNIEKAAKSTKSKISKINAISDAKYIDAVKKGEMTKEQAIQALEEVGRKDSKAYAELTALEGTKDILGETFEQDEQFDESDFIIEDQSSQPLTPQLQQLAESLTLQQGNVPSNNKKEVLFNFGKYTVYNDFNSISKYFDGKKLTKKEIDDYNKVLIPKGFEITYKLNKKGAIDKSGDKYLVEVKKIESSTFGTTNEETDKKFQEKEFFNRLNKYIWNKSSDTEFDSSFDYNVKERNKPLTLEEADKLLNKLIANKEIEEICPDKNDFDY